MKANRYIAKFIDTLDNLDLQGTRIPGLILSHPGFGKTSTIRKFCEYRDYNLETIIPSQSAADDILGLQSIKDGVLTRLTPSWFNKLEKTMQNGKRTVLFIDEISTCDPYIQGPLLDLIFSRNLGERHLPENVFIIAAGNYSGDLNGEFHMSAPLINRFVLLNLMNKDFDIRELLEDTNTFEDLNDAAKIEKYFDLKTSKKPAYDYNLFVKWIKDEKEVTFEKTTSEEDEEYGLLGFTSIRSLNYSLKFAQNYMARFNDDLWCRVVGDTLGTSAKHEGFPLQKIFTTNRTLFEAKEKVEKTASSVGEISDRIKKEGLSDDLLRELETTVNSILPEDITRDDLRRFIEAAAPYIKSDDETVKNNIKRINQKIFNKVNA